MTMVFPENQDAPPDEAEAPGRRCARCGGVSTHFLTCPALKLPPGYRISDSRSQQTAR